MVGLCASDGSLSVHACLLACRASALWQRFGGRQVLLEDVSLESLHDFVAYLYCERLPWDQVSSPRLVQRIEALKRTALSLEVLPLARLCAAWLFMHGGARYRCESAVVIRVSDFEVDRIVGLLTGDALTSGIFTRRGK
mmetsp:Transcript_26087/g.84283  ORF Transcript_26087/g.84283 Transcript_26087/m.84283 type:complete len:139 (-) Transcript_26087:24-440(-)